MTSTRIRAQTETQRLDFAPGGLGRKPAAFCGLQECADCVKVLAEIALRQPLLPSHQMESDLREEDDDDDDENHHRSHVATSAGLGRDVGDEDEEDNSLGRTNQVSQLLAFAWLPRKVRSGASRLRGEYEEGNKETENEKEIGGQSRKGGCRPGGRARLQEGRQTVGGRRGGGD